MGGIHRKEMGIQMDVHHWTLHLRLVTGSLAFREQHN